LIFLKNNFGGSFDLGRPRGRCTPLISLPNVYWLEFSLDNFIFRNYFNFLSSLMRIFLKIEMKYYCKGFFSFRSSVCWLSLDKKKRWYCTFLFRLFLFHIWQLLFISLIKLYRTKLNRKSIKVNWVYPSYWISLIEFFIDLKQKRRKHLSKEKLFFWQNKKALVEIIYKRGNPSSLSIRREINFLH